MPIPPPLINEPGIEKKYSNINRPAFKNKVDDANQLLGKLIDKYEKIRSVLFLGKKSAATENIQTLLKKEDVDFGDKLFAIQKYIRENPGNRFATMLKKEMDKDLHLDFRKQFTVHYKTDAMRDRLMDCYEKQYGQDPGSNMKTASGFVTFSFEKRETFQNFIKAALSSAGKIISCTYKDETAGDDKYFDVNPSEIVEVRQDYLASRHRQASSQQTPDIKEDKIKLDVPKMGSP